MVFGEVRESLDRPLPSKSSRPVGRRHRLDGDVGVAGTQIYLADDLIPNEVCARMPEITEWGDELYESILDVAGVHRVLVSTEHIC